MELMEVIDPIGIRGVDKRALSGGRCAQWRSCKHNLTEADGECSDGSPGDDSVLCRR